MELDAEPAQKPLAKIRQAKRFLRAGEEIVAAAKVSAGGVLERSAGRQYG